ncbi:hypothetical protein FRB99_000052 [Tulasnella sp. 403]|nr:hypothetical protein FRB99_000052 [Tulasnella sp. 403]
MHARNLYQHTYVDFSELAEAYPALKPYVFVDSKGKPNINFKDANALRCLTQGLLHRDFNLTLSLPTDRLCPPVPNRLDYVLWIQDVIESTKTIDNSLEVVGMDIGTGASAIYPLLACRLRSNWRMIATEVDQVSLDFAIENVKRNDLSSNINVVQSLAEGSIFGALDSSPTLRPQFSMCNPPFYSSADEIMASSEAKELGPHAVCTGAPVEMVTEGGEVGFVTRMVLESKVFGDRIRWYTSLLGKSSSVMAIVEVLKNNKIFNYGIQEFVQSHTKRWAVAWSLTGHRLPDKLCRVPKALFHGSLPLPNELIQSYPGASKAGLKECLSTLLSGLPLVRLEGTAQEDAFLVHAAANCWSRAARRKQAYSAPIDNIGPTIMTCNLRLESGNDNDIQLRCRWIYGLERDIFETFWSHITRKVTDMLRGN